MKKAFFLFWIFALPLAQADSGGLQTSGTVDILGQAAGSATKRLDVREAEILLYAPTDAWWDGVINAAAHLENGVSTFEIHEAYLGSSKLIPRVRFRAGQFFLGVGRLNMFHRHDWPFPSAPLVHSTFFDDEAAIDTGLEASWLLPLPVYLDWTFGVTNGWNFGHAHTIGFQPAFPTHYTRLATSFDALGATTLVGANYVGRVNSVSTGTYLFGVDWTSKCREGKTLLFLLQSELWWRLTRPLPSVGTAEDAFGFYVYPQIALSPSFRLGVRLDSYAVTNLVGSAPTVAVLPVIGYDPSEFTHFRLAFKQEWPTQDRVVELQMTYFLGAHPSHDF